MTVLDFEEVTSLIASESRETCLSTITDEPSKYLCFHRDKRERLHLCRWADFPNFLSENFWQERADTSKNNQSLVTLAFFEARVTIIRKIDQCQ